MARGQRDASRVDSTFLSLRSKLRPWWLKRQLGGLHPIGNSRNAVWLTILLVAIAALIMNLLDADRDG